MKAFKKFFALLLALLMTMSLLATTAMAAPETSGSITINHAHTGHQYVAYQIFDGSLSGGVLTNIEWGSGINYEATNFIDDVRKVKRNGVEVLSAFNGNAEALATLISGWSKDDASLKALAEVFAKYVIGTPVSISYATDKYTATVDDPGYYLIMDSSPLEDATSTDYLLQLVGTVNITPKAVNPTFNKLVNTRIDGTFVEAISVEVDETFYVKLESQMPSMLDDYKQYFLSFEEEIPAHLENAKIVDVFLQHSTTSTSLVDEAYRAEAVTSGIPDGEYTYFVISHPTVHEGETTKNYLRIDFKNLKKIDLLNSNDILVVKYAVTATEKMPVVGGSGNVREATLYFTSDMNQAAPADTNATLATASDIRRATMRNDAAVYTYGVDIDKIDSNSKAKLGGAEFALYRTKNIVEGNTEVQKDFYAIFAKDPDTSRPTHYRVIGWEEISTTNTLDENNKVTSYSAEGDNKGEIIITGLGGNVAYNLKEITPPDQYNSMDAPAIIEVIPTISGITLTELAGKADGSDVTGNKDHGLIYVTIENNKGNTLPTTGGMGTTIFYIVGGVLVMGAAAAFVMKRRNEA